MSDYAHICSIRGVDQKLLNYLADKIPLFSVITRHRGDVVNDGLRLLALLYYDLRRADGIDYRSKAIREEDIRAFVGDLLDRPRPWSGLRTSEACRTGRGE